MNEKILALLRDKTAYVSGEEISRRLGITRSAIWKHIQELRQQGYEILAVPHRGYELVSTPDKLLAEEISFGLNTKIIGKQIMHYDMVSSTMDAAMEWGIKGAAEGSLICAEGQYKGRGRLGREWVSAKQKGIYLSLILRPNITPLASPQLTLLSAVAVCGAIRTMTRLDCRIKWPNDLLIDNKKVGGILTEMNAETDRVKFIVIGIGINVNTPASTLPPKATSLKEQRGEQVSRLDLTRKILQALETEYVLFQQKGFAAVIEKWKKLSTTLGHRVKIVFGNEHIEGEALDIDEDGGLLVRRDSGFTEKVLVGDVTKVR